MPMPTPEQAAAKWSTGLQGATERITQGVQATTVAPGQAAARQKAVYQQNVTAAVDKWATRVAAVPLQEWQQAMIEKGAPRVAQGAQAAQPKVAQFMGQLLPHIQSQVQALPPRGNLESNINRMTQFVRGMSKFQRR